jgi:hypothetical protein
MRLDRTPLEQVEYSLHSGSRNAALLSKINANSFVR